MSTQDDQIRDLLALMTKRQESTNRWLEEVSRKLAGRDLANTIKWGVFWGIVLAVLVYILLFLLLKFLAQELLGVGIIEFLTRR